jgi:hypothetical protein
MFGNPNLGIEFWNLHHFWSIKRKKPPKFPNFDIKLKEIWT